MYIGYVFNIGLVWIVLKSINLLFESIKWKKSFVMLLLDVGFGVIVYMLCVLLVNDVLVVLIILM